MLYSEEHYPEAVDLKSAVNRLKCQLDDILQNIIFNQQCRPGYYLGSEADKVLYHRGVDLCDAYLKENISLRWFGKEMIKIGLKKKFCSLYPFLPEDIKENVIGYDVPG